jgi:hypothetical protein
MSAERDLKPAERVPDGAREEYRSLTTTIAIAATPLAIVAAPVVGAVAEHVLNKPKGDPPPQEHKK